MGRYRRPLHYRTWWRLLRWTISTSWAHRGAWGRGLPAAGVAAAAGMARWWVLPASPVEAVVAGAVLAIVPVVVWRLSPPRRGERLGKTAALAVLLAWVFTGWWPLALTAAVLVVAAHVRDPREHVVRRRRRAATATPVGAAPLAHPPCPPAVSGRDGANSPVLD